MVKFYPRRLANVSASGPLASSDGGLFLKRSRGGASDGASSGRGDSPPPVDKEHLGSAVVVVHRGDPTRDELSLGRNRKSEQLCHIRVGFLMAEYEETFPAEMLR